VARSREITAERFNTLLAWLDEDRGRAGEKYESIRHSLIKIFAWRGLNDAEDLADETINRVTLKVDGLIGSYKGDPTMYFYAVAKNLMLEATKSRQRHQRMPLAALKSLAAGPDSDELEAELRAEALDRCLSKLTKEHRRLLINYYREQKESKITRRKAMAKTLDLRGNTLRVRVHRIRAKLEGCVRSELAHLRGDYAGPLSRRE